MLTSTKMRNVVHEDKYPLRELNVSQTKELQGVNKEIKFDYIIGPGVVSMHKIYTPSLIEFA